MNSNNLHSNNSENFCPKCGRPSIYCICESKDIFKSATDTDYSQSLYEPPKSASYSSQNAQSKGGQSFFKKHKAVLITIAAILCAGALFAVLFAVFPDRKNESPTATVSQDDPAFYYELAKSQIESGNYTEAYQNLKKCGNHKDSRLLLEDFKVVHRQINEVYYGSDGDFTTYTYEYDEKGNLVSQYNFTEDDYEIERSHVYTYDENGNVASDICDGWDAYHSIYEYDNYGRVIYEDFTGKHAADIYNYEYDENGNLILESRFDKAFEMNYFFKYSYEYDEHNNCIAQIIYGPDGNFRRKREYAYEYDENGNKTAEFHDNVLMYEYTYNENGFLTSTTAYQSDGSSSLKYKCSYYDDDTVKHEIHYSSNGYIQLECSYDKNGNLTKKSEYDSHGYLTNKHEYTYDENNNNRLSVDNYRGGSFESKYEYEYDENNYIISELRYTSENRLYCKIDYLKPLLLYGANPKEGYQYFS